MGSTQTQNDEDSPCRAYGNDAGAEVSAAEWHVPAAEIVDSQHGDEPVEAFYFRVKASLSGFDKTCLYLRTQSYNTATGWRLDDRTVLVDQRWHDTFQIKCSVFRPIQRVLEPVDISRRPRQIFLDERQKHLLSANRVMRRE